MMQNRRRRKTDWLSSLLENLIVLHYLLLSLFAALSGFKMVKSSFIRTKLEHSQTIHSWFSAIAIVLHRWMYHVLMKRLLLNQKKERPLDTYSRTSIVRAFFTECKTTVNNAHLLSGHGLLYQILLYERIVILQLQRSGFFSSALQKMGYLIVLHSIILSKNSCLPSAILFISHLVSLVIVLPISWLFGHLSNSHGSCSLLRFLKYKMQLLLNFRQKVVFYATFVD